MARIDIRKVGIIWGKSVVYIHKMYRKIDATNIWQSLKNILLAFLYSLIVIGTVAYIYRYIFALIKHEEIESPIQLAITAITLGGFILLGAFYRRGLEYEQRLKTIAKLFLLAAIFFIIVLLLLNISAMIQSPPENWLSQVIIEWLLPVVVSISIIVASISFAVALVFLLNMLRDL